MVILFRKPSFFIAIELGVYMLALLIMLHTKCCMQFIKLAKDICKAPTPDNPELSNFNFF